jgi:hypothetical protein
MAGVGLNPDGFAAGGFLDDCDITIRDPKFTLFDYGGQSEEVPVLSLDFEQDDGETHNQVYSVGKAKDWRPSDDGKTLVSIGSAAALSKRSNAGQFITHLVEAGFPGERLEDGDVSVLDGLKAHVTRIAQPRRRNMPDDKPDPTLLVIDKVLEMPEDGGKAKKTTKAKASSKGKEEEDVPSANDQDVSIEQKAQEALLKLITDSGGKLPKKGIPQPLFKLLGDDPDKSKILTKAFDDEFLSNGPWTYEDGELSLG